MNDIKYICEYLGLEGSFNYRKTIYSFIYKTDVYQFLFRPKFFSVFKNQNIMSPNKVKFTDIIQIT